MKSIANEILTHLSKINFIEGSAESRIYNAMKLKAYKMLAIAHMNIAYAGIEHFSMESIDPYNDAYTSELTLKHIGYAQTQIDNFYSVYDRLRFSDVESEKQYVKK